MAAVAVSARRALGTARITSGGTRIDTPHQPEHQPRQQRAFYIEVVHSPKGSAHILRSCAIDEIIPYPLALSAVVCAYFLIVSDKSCSLRLTLVSGGIPERHRSRVVLSNDRGQSHGAACPKATLALPQQLGGEALPPVLGMNHELVEAAAPSIPCCDQ